MSLDATEHAIYQLATECDSLFQQALLNESAPTYRALLEYHQRFELWCGYLGVLAQPELSLDRRVQFNEDVRRNILELLLLIRTSLSRGKVSLKRISSLHIHQRQTCRTMEPMFQAKKCPLSWPKHWHPTIVLYSNTYGPLQRRHWGLLVARSTGYIASR
jgi:hypothetical protein